MARWLCYLARYKSFVASVGELIKAENVTLKTVLMAEIKSIKEENTKEHEEIMDKLAESNEVNGKHLKDHETRIRELEGRKFPHSH